MGIDESWLYPGMIVVLLIFAFMQWRENATKTMIFILFVLAYIIYSHETGHSLGELKEEAIESFDEAVGNSKYKQRVVTPALRGDEANRSVK